MYLLPDIYFRDSIDGLMQHVLISESRMLVFSLKGEFQRELDYDFGRGAMIPVDVLSVLQVGTNYELALNLKGVFYRTDLTGRVGEVLSAVGRITGMRFAGVRKGVVADVSYTQYMYVFSEGLLSEEWLKYIN